MGRGRRVAARTCNGIESAKGAAVPPEFYYWDGQILKAKDGKYHMFMSTWSGTAGFNPGWQSSDAYHAISSQGVLGPYMRQGFVYTNNNSHKGHNVSALELPDGSYAVVVSETVPFTIYRSTSLDGPWTGCVAQIQTNGIKTVSTVACPPGGACGDAHHEANVSLVARHDGRYEIAQRHGFIAIADTLCGPYRMQKPTWTYPQANLPNVDSIYPKRTSIPGVSNPTYGWEEDPHIWYSGGVYHVIYSGSQDRVGYHLYSTDGLTNWKDNGYGWSPREYQKIFGYEGSTTYTQWYKMERPGVVLENGHPTHITWAVADVDKDNQIPGNSNHGSKVIVVPFDGVAFDADFGTAERAGGTGGGGAAGGRAASRERAEARAAAARGVAARRGGRSAGPAADVAAPRAPRAAPAARGVAAPRAPRGAAAAAVPGPAVPPAAARPAERRRPAARAARLQWVAAAAAPPPAVVVEAAARLPAGRRAQEASAAVRVARRRAAAVAVAAPRPSRARTALPAAAAPWARRRATARSCPVCCSARWSC